MRRAERPGQRAGGGGRTASVSRRPPARRPPALPAWSSGAAQPVPLRPPPLAILSAG